MQLRGFVMHQGSGFRGQIGDGNPGDRFTVSDYLNILRRRVFYLAIPFVLVVFLGAFVVAIQRPIYSAEGKLLVESQEIPTELVRPTVTTAATERIQVIQQRITARDNLLAIINKYALFPSERKWMSGTQLLDLMKERMQIKLVDLNLAVRQSNVTIAFTVGFEYEEPELAMKVANEFVTSILSEDARNRNNRAVETTKFLARETSRLETELGAIEAQIAELKRHPRDLIGSLAGQGASPDPNLMQLAALKADLIQKSSIYSKAHPELKVLKQKIAALEEAIGQVPEAAKPAVVNQTSSVDVGLEPLLRQQLNVEKALEESTRKLAAARLGESLERDQQAERLQVIEQPTMPQKPIKPNRSKLLAMVFALAAIAGGGVLVAAEKLDHTIRHKRELFNIIDSQLIVAIPYIYTNDELRQRRKKVYYYLLLFSTVLVFVITAVILLGPPIDVLLASLWQYDFSRLQTLTHLAR
jgi:uncharacterized protein involved in exopolysaccharide biosynthesis